MLKERKEIRSKSIHEEGKCSEKSRSRSRKSSGESERDEGHVETAEHQNKKRLPVSVRRLKEHYSDSSEDCTSEVESGSDSRTPCHDCVTLLSYWLAKWCKIQRSFQQPSLRSRIYLFTFNGVFLSHDYINSH